MQRCLCDYCLVPTFEKHLIYDNGASIKNKGYSFAVNRMEEHLRKHYQKYGHKGYIARYDFTKYFDNISHELIEKLVRMYVKDKRLADLTMHFVEMFGEKGLGLGSQVSQILAVSAPNELDHFIKDELGVKLYGRYMDDFYIIHHNREYLKEISVQIKRKSEELGMTLNCKKTKIKQINNTEFLKIRWFLTPTGRVAKKPDHKSIVRVRRKLKKLRKKVEVGEITIEDVYMSWQSWNAHISRTNSKRERREIKLLFKQLFGKEVDDVFKNNKTK